MGETDKIFARHSAAGHYGPRRTRYPCARKEGSEHELCSGAAHMSNLLIGSGGLLSPSSPPTTWVCASGARRHVISPTESASDAEFERGHMFHTCEPSANPSENLSVSRPTTLRSLVRFRGKCGGCSGNQFSKIALKNERSARSSGFPPSSAVPPVYCLKSLSGITPEVRCPGFRVHVQRRLSRLLCARLAPLP